LPFLIVFIRSSHTCIVEVPLPSLIAQSSLTCPISSFLFFTSFRGNSPNVSPHSSLVKRLIWSSVKSDAWSLVFQSVTAVELWWGSLCWMNLNYCCSLINKQLFIFLSCTKYLCWATCGLHGFAIRWDFWWNPTTLLY